MSAALRIQRVRKEYLINRVRTQVENAALVAVAHVGNMDTADRMLVKKGVEAAGGSITFTKNGLVAKGLERAGADGLVPLLRGHTMLATGPAEVPVASALHDLSKSMPSFFVLGALLEKRRLLQFAEVDKLAKLPSREHVHTKMVAQMLPGSSLQVPNVAAYLCSILQHHVEQQQQQQQQQ